MTLPIIEQSLYGQLKIETAPWANPFVYTDHTASLVNGIKYSEGGKLGTPGESTVDVGRLTATFKNLATIPTIGSVVRISFDAFGGYAFTGYVQDVGQKIVFDQSVSLLTPITLTTLYCNDWVGYVSQFQAIGAGGNTSPSGVAIETSDYYYFERVMALNLIQDQTNNTRIIESLYDVNGTRLGDTDLVGSLTDHLDLVARSQPDFYWYGSHNLPTNITTGRNSLIYSSLTGATPATGKTFTDEVGSAGQLHYTEIEFENSSANVANNIVLTNRSRIHIETEDVTRIGGFNEENFVVVNDQHVRGIGRDVTYELTDATSVTTYGVRRSDIETNVSYWYSTAVYNLIINPSLEYSEDGYAAGTGCLVRRRIPAEEANPFNAYVGNWSERCLLTTNRTTAQILYSGGEADGIPVTAGTFYYFKGWAARDFVSRTDMRVRIEIQWRGENEAVLATTLGSFTTLTTAKTWYEFTTAVTAPANAVRATFIVLFNRSGGGNITSGDMLWLDALMFSTSSNSYFDGDFVNDTNYIYGYTGAVGLSPSYRVENFVDELATQFLDEYSTTSMRVTRIRWNAQEDLTAVPEITVGESISLRYDGVTTSYRIIGIDGDIDPERYMIDYYLTKI